MNGLQAVGVLLLGTKDAEASSRHLISAYIEGILSCFAWSEQ